VSDRTGALQAISVRGLLNWAHKHDLFVAMESSVGDFVITGRPVLTVYGSETLSAAEIRRLRGLYALGVERTIEQDPAFALRIIVDIAVKALSAAINDPTTAVQAIDHLETVLRVLGSTELRSILTFADDGGAPRLQMPGRTWEDFLTLGVTEIREYGCNAIQVTRRLRAMLEDLRDAIRPENRTAVDAEIARLDATVEAGFSGSIDTDRADESDRQGIGGPAQGTRGHAA
jgi:uncharacterized membrane protein